MTIDELLAEVRARAITLWADGERLRVSAPTGALTAPLQAELSKHKAAILDRLRAADTPATAVPPVVPVPRDGRLPLSFGQERLWFMQQMDPEGAAYNIFTVLPLKRVDVALLERSLTELVRRHEPLRTVFPVVDGQPVQQILPPAPVAITVADLRSIEDAAARGTEAQRIRFAEIRRPFVLATGPVIRFLLIHLTAGESELVITQHHIATDGWSLSVMLEDLTAIHAALAAGRPSPLADPPLQYADFAVWQRQTLRGGALDRELAYWRRQLANVQPLDLPTDFPRPAIQTFNGASQTVWIGDETARALRAVSREQGVSEFMALLASLKILLARYTGQTDIAVGTSNGNRNRVELERVLGFFVQTQVLRSDLSGDPTAREVLTRVRQATVDALANQDVPFEMLVEELRPARDLSRSPFLDVMFIMQNTPLEALARGTAGKREGDAAATDLTRTVFASQTVDTDAGTRVVMASGTAQFDITMSLVDTGAGFRGVIEYNTDLFEHATVARMASHFEALVAAIAANPDLRISEIPLLRPAELRRFEQWNATTREYPRDRTVVDLFAAQVERTPDAIAVECGSERLTYRELQQRAAALARRLQQQGLRPDARAGIFVDRSIDLVVSALAVLESGGAYVPLDPIYPADRIAYMLEDAQASLVVSESALAGKLPDGTFRVISVEGSDPGLTPSGSLPSARRAGVENLAYVIYTSGSTGRPKGVQIPHGALVNFLTSMAAELDLPAAPRLLAVTTLCFDIAALELYLPLVTGGTVIVATREETGDAAKLLARMRASKPSVMQATPATWRMLLESGWSGDRDLRILCGGEALPRPLANELVPRCKVLWNMYGPTETTIWSAVDRVQAGSTPVLVGHPIANTDFCVLDRDLRPVPIGVAGELFIGGDGLARGYFNRPDLTAAAFVPHPFGKTPGARIYRTGDLVRFRSDGRIEWLSRIDHQVKLRGFRIELGEIESVLARHADVEQAVARVREDVPGDARLVAYIVPAPGRTVDIAALKELAGASLPQYMHPAAYVVLDALPMTPNGKVDRKALPAPERTAGARETVAPRSDMEERIAAVWRDVLRLDRVSVRENFFDLGGHSLLLVQVQARLSRELGRDVPVVELFQFPTIETLARHLGGEKPARTFSEQAASRVRRRGDRGSDFIAVIGLAGRFPSSPDVDAFWTNLQHGVEGVRQFSDDELRAAGTDERWLTAPDFVKARGFLEGVELFDAAFFGFTPKEAALMDPQQRLFLECAYEALERAGYNPRSAGSVGVFAGCSMNTYLPYVFAQGADIGGAVDMLLNSDKDHLATRVSYELNLKGPGVSVQTACSTSLVAVHLACRSLLDGECDMALAGGVSVTVPTVGGYQYVEGNILSPDGHCRPFDEAARGTVGGSGVGIVVLKRLDDAIADGDRVRAVIRGTAINNDGSSKVGYTAPSVEGQAEAIAAAQAAAGVDPDTIGYIEAHGTGTTLGDPIEIQALSQVFGEKTSRKQFCAIGALKSNIGHLDAAAGVAGLIKTVLTVEHGELPPTINFERPNPRIDFAGSPFFVNSERRPWMTQAGALRRAGVSSFGLGGTNAHAVVEQAPPRDPSGTGREWQPLVVSARTEDALESQAARLAAYLRSHADANLADVAFTLQEGRESFDRRRLVVANSVATAVAALEGQDRARSWKQKAASRPSIVFMFPGQGTQYVGMARELYEHEAGFRAAVDECASLLQPELQLDVRSVLWPADASDSRQAADTLSRSQVTQAALFVVEYALARQLMAWGIEPDAMIGHSIGEYVAAAVSGVLTLGDALRLVALRGRLMDQASAGAMTAVPLAESRVRAMLNDELWLSAINAPDMCVVAGTPAAIDAFEARLKAEGVDTRRLQTSGAFHSALMSHVAGPLDAAAKAITPGAPKIPYVSNVTGTWIAADDLESAGYWGRHVTQPVKFADGVATLLEKGADLFVEIGPGLVLSTFVRQIAAARGNTDAATIPTVRHVKDDGSDVERLTAAVGRLWLHGAEPDWRAWQGDGRRLRVELPTYPFERRRHWIERSTQPAAARAGLAVARHAITKNAEMAAWFSAPSWKSTVSPLHTETAANVPSTWLVFGDGGGLSSSLIDSIRSRGGSAVVVTAGTAFDATVTDRFTIDPANPKDFARLFTSLSAAGRAPQAIVHLWGVTAAADRDDIGASARDRAFYSVLHLAQTLTASGTSPVRLAIVTSGAERVTGAETLRPLHAAIRGLARVVPQEIDHVVTATIDVEADALVEDAIADHLVAEVAAGLLDVAVAYRGGQRWIQSYEPMPIAAPARERLPIRDGGVYLITGGLGRVGLDFAEHLIALGGAHVYLTRRTEFPARETWDAWIASHDAKDVTSRAIAAVGRIEALGGGVTVLSADAADEAQMRRALETIDRAHGRLDGVIHAAGILSGGALGPLAGFDRQACERQFTAKMDGLLLLDRLLAGRTLDFRLLMSSLSAVLGGVGYGIYASGNAFLDAFAASRARGSAGRWLSVNWDGWRHGDDTGAPVSAAERFSMTSGEGVEALDRVLSVRGQTQIVVSTGDVRARVAEWLSRGAPAAPQRQTDATVDDRPEMDEAYVAPRNDIEEAIAGIWSDLFGIARIGVHDNFFALGGHSLLATRLGSRVRQEFQVSLGLDALFAAPTVAGLAEAVMEQMLSEVDGDALDPLLNDLRGV